MPLIPTWLFFKIHHKTIYLLLTLLKENIWCIFSIIIFCDAYFLPCFNIVLYNYRICRIVITVLGTYYSHFHLYHKLNQGKRNFSKDPSSDLDTVLFIFFAQCWCRKLNLALYQFTSIYFGQQRKVYIYTTLSAKLSNINKQMFATSIDIS